jgi:enterochelin esterase-like enzyme
LFTDTPDDAGRALPSPTPPGVISTPNSTSAPLVYSTTTATAEICLENQGAVEPFSLTRNGREITGRIYTPPCYSDRSESNYPVLYLLHGDTVTEQQWEDLGLFDLADELIAGGDIPPLIIVLPREKTWIPLPGNPFGDLIVTELIPWVDTNYSTVGDRQSRAIGGLSRGGNWAVRLGLLHWGLFGSIGAHSTPLFFGDLERIPGWIQAIPDTKIPRIFLDIGADDNDLLDAVALEEKLLDLNIPHSWHLFPGSHTESYWRDHLKDYLLWYSFDW